MWRVDFLEVQQRTYRNTRGPGRAKRTRGATETLMRNIESTWSHIHLWMQFEAGLGKKKNPKRSNPTAGARWGVALLLAIALSRLVEGPGDVIGVGV